MSLRLELNMVNSISIKYEDNKCYKSNIHYQGILHDAISTLKHKLLPTKLP